MDQAAPALAQLCLAVTIGLPARSVPTMLGPDVSPILRYETPNHGPAPRVSQWQRYWKFEVNDRLLSESWA